MIVTVREKEALSFGKRGNIQQMDDVCALNSCYEATFFVRNLFLMAINEATGFLFFKFRRKWRIASD